MKAVFLGGLTDIVASTILGISLGAHVISSHSLRKLHKDALHSAIVATVHGSPSLYAAQLLIGFGSSILGGFVAANLSKENKRLNAILAAWLSVAIGIRALVTGQDGMSPAVVVFVIALTPLCYLLGASLQARRAASRSSQA